MFWQIYPLGVSVRVVSDTRRRSWATTALPRVLLVVAVTLGLCAMHVFAAAVSQRHAAAHDMTTAHDMTVSAVAVDHGAATASVAAHGTATTHVSDHGDHHAMSDCVLFLSAGVALLMILIAWGVARALRCTHWPVPAWRQALMAITPWRGPPPWHWPRIALCVIRL